MNLTQDENDDGLYHEIMSTNWLHKIQDLRHETKAIHYKLIKPVVKPC